MSSPQVDTISDSLSQLALEQTDKKSDPGVIVMHPNEAITTQNQKTSPLLRLPPELRNKIYEYVCGGYNIEMTTHKLPYSFYTIRNWGTGPWLAGWTDKENPTILSCVSRQLHLETCMLPFEINVFRLTSSTGFANFLNVLSEKQRTAIKTVDVTLNNMRRLAREVSQFWNQIESGKPLPEGLDDKHLSPFLDLSGLKRVVVTVSAAHAPAETERLDRVPKKACEAMVRQLGARSRAKIRYKRASENRGLSRSSSEE